MGITSALYSGVSGLNTNGTAISVIGNNLANTNTIGYKGSRVIFSDLLSSSVSGSGGTSQVGRGVGLGTVDNVFSQGTFETTQSGLDLAIQGSSFFIVSDPDEATAYYTRAGSFNFDADGYLVNPEGYRVQGIAYEDGVLVGGDPSDIYLDGEGLVQGKSTDALTLTTNLDANSDVIDRVGDATAVPPIDPITFDHEDPSTYTYSSSTQVFDSLGNAHLLTTYFTKTADNTWEAQYTAQDKDGNTYGDTDTPVVLNFTPDGQLQNDTVTLDVTGFNWGNGSTDVNIAIGFDCTQFNSDSVVISQDQNGYGAGSLSGVSLDTEGNIVASYSNGEKRLVAGVTLAKFTDPTALTMEGGNLFGATLESGAARIGLPDPELGSIFAYSLEMSNVDIAQEMVTMITIQRGYQANSKIITTVDELLDDVINLKR